MKARILFTLTAILALLSGANAQATTKFRNSGAFVVPAGVTQVTVECWGGGGRGGTRNTNGGGGGGGGGAYVRSVVSVTPGSSYTVTVGNGSNGIAAGGDSWFLSNTTILAQGGNSALVNSSSGALGGGPVGSIGTVIFSGGNGADAVTDGGGGGASGGSASNGGNGSGPTGGMAPLGGGAGGNGRIGNQGRGVAGLRPGAGGGGAKRVSTGNRSGGNGAKGEVWVSYNFPLATCVPSRVDTRIVDNGCATSQGITVKISVSGLPIQLGGAPGNAVLSRMRMIIRHTSLRDLNIRLTSPSDQTRDLVLERFGTGDHLGNPSTCPGAPFILADGGSALTNSNINRPTGPYAPEQPFSGFFGDPNGEWTLFICDGTSTVRGNLRFLDIEFGVRDCLGVVNGPALPGTACDDGDPTTLDDVYTTGCTCVVEDNVLYSVASGDFSDNIWSYSPQGSPSGVLPDAFSSTVVTNGTVVKVDGTQHVRDLTIQTGGTMGLATGTLVINGSGIYLNGALTGDLGNMIVEGSDLVTLQAGAVPEFFNLTVNNAQGLNTNGPIRILGTLQLNAGVFTAAEPVRLVSNATRTGRLGPVDPTASFIGNMIVERFIPGGATNWRLLGSPVQGRTVADWNDDFFTAGFPGSNYPNFYSGGVLWPSVRLYDETNAGAGINDGLDGVVGTAHALTPGQGFASWSGDNSGGTSAFIVDVTGPPTIASTPITLPMTWTNTATASADGWNLVSNPLPSPITFTAVSRGADVQNAYWIFNPANGNNAAWSNGVSTNGATGVIQSSQGFWMRTSGSAVTTTVSESAKTGNGSGGFFGGQEELAIPMIRLAINSSVNGYSDEAVVAFHEGTPGTDALDARSFVFSHPQAPRISTLSTDGEAMAISMYGDFSNSISIPVLVDVAVTGTYTITASEMDLISGLSCLTLEDLITGAITPMNNGAIYSFSLNANANATAPRFMLHASAPLLFAAQNATCSNNNDGRAEVVLTSGPTDVVWSDAFGTLLLSQPSMPIGEAVIDGLAPGNYQVSVGTSTACGLLTNQFTITAPFGIEAEAQTTAASCSDANNGSIAIEVMGGVAPYNFLWSTGATEEQLSEVAVGTYDLSIADANGCSIELLGLVVTAPAPVVGEVLAPEASAMNETIEFATTADPSSTLFWEFGDGSTSVEAGPQHSYALPGDYTITLTITDGNCDRSVQHDISVFVSTGVEDVQVQEFKAWSTPSELILINGPGLNGDIRVYDPAGRIVTTQRMAAGSERVEIPIQAWPTGIYHLTVITQAGSWSVSLPITR